MGAAVVPVTLLAAELRWEEVIISAAAAGILLLTAPGKSMIWNVAVIILCVASALQSMRMLSNFSPETESCWIAVILLILGIYGACKGKKETAEGGILLLRLLGILLGGLLLSGFPEIRWENINNEYGNSSPRWFCISLTIVLYLTVCVNQQTAKKEAVKTWGIIILYAAAVSLAVQGMLGNYRENTGMRLYELSINVQYLGGMKRFESLIILSVLLGIYLWISYLVRKIADRTEQIRNEIKNRKKIEKTG